MFSCNLRSPRLPAFGWLALALVALASPAHAQLCDTYWAQLTAAQLVPPSDSGARADFSGQFLSSCMPCSTSWDGKLTVQISDVVGLSGLPTVVRICQGGPTENGLMLFEWPIPEPDHYGLPFEVDFGSEHCAALDDSLLYIVVGTAAHPEGEARGPIYFVAASPVQETTWGRLRTLFRR